MIQKRNPAFVLDENIDFIMLFSFSVQTALSLFRGFKFLFFLKSPKMSMLGKNVRFNFVHKFKFGKYLKLGNEVRICALGKSGISFGNNVSIGSYSQIVVSTTLNQIGEHISIGNNVGIGEFAYLGGAGGLNIEDDCIIGQYFSCHPENHIAKDIHAPIKSQGVTRKGIHIGQNCWIGAKVSILDGVSIGFGSIIACGAVVTQSFPPYSVIGGVPAKLLKSRI